MLLFLLLLACFSQETDSCGVVVTSSCTLPASSTKWNNVDVAAKLKEWILSLKKQDVDPGLPLSHKKYFVSFQGKRNQDITRFIGNWDCDGSNLIIGNVWLIPNPVSREFFHDGYLYGQLDNEGQLTGT